jgi:hypothetical protein
MVDVEALLEVFLEEFQAWVYFPSAAELAGF